MREIKKKEVIAFNPRQPSKNIESYLHFFDQGKKGVSIVYMTPKGNFLTPKAVENLLREVVSAIVVRQTSVMTTEGEKYVNKQYVQLDHILKVFKEKGVTL